VIRLEMGLESGNVTPAEEKVSQILRKEFDEEPSRDFQTNLEILKEKLSDKLRPIGVLIDNLEPALDANFRFLEKLRGYEDLLRILGDRDVCSFTLITSRRSLIVQRVKVHEYSLQGLDIEAWREYFHDCENGANSEDLEQMRDAYNGNAKAMEILHGAITNSERFDGNIAAYWNRNKDALLADSELETLILVEMDWLRDNQLDAYNLLCRIGCYRYQDVKTIPFDGLVCLLWDVDESQKTIVVGCFSKNSLVSEIKNEYFLHPYVREFAKSRLIKNQIDWEIANHKAANFWTNSITVIRTVEDCIQAFEAFYHLLSIEDWGNAAQIVIQNRKNDFQDYKDGERLGFSLQRLGLTEYRKIFEQLIEKIDKDEILVSMNHMIGQLMQAEGYSKRAIPYFQETANIASRLKWEEGQISAMYAVGICQIELWNIEKSVEIYTAIVPRYLDIHGLSKNIESNAHLSKVFVQLLFSKNIVNCTSDHQSSIDIFVNTLKYIEQIQLGLSHHEKVINRLLAAKACENIGDYQEAKYFCNSAYEIASKGYSSQLQSRSLTFLASIYRNQRDFKSALTEVSKGLNKISRKSMSGYDFKYRYELALALLELGLIHQDIGNISECNKYFDESQRIFMSIESLEQVNRVKLLQTNYEYI
jgi:tetratricopeptide (TPR) repeat protein